MNNRTSPALFLAALVLTVGLSFAGPSRDYCGATAHAAQTACVLGANSDSELAKAKCLNTSAAPAARACRQAATDEKKEALEDCKDQLEARIDVCRELGPAIYDPPIDPNNFGTTVDNPFFPLTPGTTYVYETQTQDGLERDVVEVTSQTRQILGVTCIEVHDAVSLEGVLAEDTLDWYAQDLSGNVWYFGENSKTIENGLVVDLEGSWEAGVDGAKPGIVMKAAPQVGDIYRQEFLLGEAEDIGRVLSLNESATVPYGSFTGLLMTEDSSPLEPDAVEHKYYASGIGTIMEVDLETGEVTELMSVTP